MFNRLTVVEELPTTRQPSGQIKRHFSLLCSCGKLIKATLDNVKSQKIKSCGCLNKDNKFKHGLSNDRLTKIWYGMHERCTKHFNYAGRGITVCEQWAGDSGLLNFTSWAYANGGDLPNLQIDRIDNNAEYSPQNCRFTTISENQRNKRNTLLVIDPSTGDSIPLISLWERDGDTDLCWETVRHRYVYLGWSVVDSITKPVRGQK